MGSGLTAADVRLRSRLRERDQLRARVGRVLGRLSKAADEIVATDLYTMRARKAGSRR